MLTSHLEMNTLVEQLFENSHFLNKLRTFNEIQNQQQNFNKESKSVRTDTSSDKCEDTQNKNSKQFEQIINEIQDLMIELCLKNMYQTKNDCHFIDASYIDQEMVSSKIQIDSARNKMLEQIQQVKKVCEQNKQKVREALTIKDHQNWQIEILEKIDLSFQRNIKKIQSIVADRLNTFQMKIVKKYSDQTCISHLNSENQSKIGCQLDQKNQFNQKIQHKRQNIVKQQIQQQKNDLLKKLKNAKSLSNLFGFKN